MARHKHLARLDRVWVESPVFYLTVCTVGRRQVLASDAMHAICRDVWNNCETKYGWRVGRYVLMPDHAHFFCWPRAVVVAGVCDPGSPGDAAARTTGLKEAGYNATSLSMFVGKWKEWTAKYANRRHGVSMPLWQAEFFDHLLRSWESYESKWNYVRENPLRAGLTTNVDDWPYQGEIHQLREL